MSLYPKAPDAPASISPADPAEIAKRIIAGFETGTITFPFTTAKYGDNYKLPPDLGKNPELAKAHFVGPCLLLADDPGDPEAPGRGSGDIATFNKVWDEIHKEKAALTGVNPVDHPTEAKYVAALDAEAVHLDGQTWADGTIAAEEVADFASLKAKKLAVAEGP